MFDDFEVNKVIGYDDNGNPTAWEDAAYAEVAEVDCFTKEDAVTARWTLYGHLSEGGVEAIADFKLRGDAYAVLALLQAPGCKPAGGTR